MTDERATLAPVIAPVEAPLVNTRLEIFIEDCTRIAEKEVAPEVATVRLACGGTVIQTGVDVAVKLGCGSSVHWSQRGLKMTCAVRVKLATI